MPSSLLGWKQRWGSDPQFLCFEAHPIPTKLVTLFKVFVRSPGGLVTVTVFPRSGFICLFSEAHPASGLADLCTHAVV